MCVCCSTSGAALGVFLRSPLNRPPFSCRTHNNTLALVQLSAGVEALARTHLGLWQAVAAGRQIPVQRLRSLEELRNHSKDTKKLHWTGRSCRFHDDRHQSRKRKHFVLLPNFTQSYDTGKLPNRTFWEYCYHLYNAEPAKWRNIIEISFTEKKQSSFHHLIDYNTKDFSPEHN